MAETAQSATGVGGQERKAGKPAERHDGSREAARVERDRQATVNFRAMTQAQRVQNRETNPAAKSIAALDSAINLKYGANTPEAVRMRAAAREAVAQTLERGRAIQAPRVRDAERLREAPSPAREAQDRANRQNQNADRER